MTVWNWQFVSICKILKIWKNPVVLKMMTWQWPDEVSFDRSSRSRSIQLGVAASGLVIDICPRQVTLSLSGSRVDLRVFKKVDRCSF